MGNRLLFDAGAVQQRPEVDRGAAGGDPGGAAGQRGTIPDGVPDVAGLYQHESAERRDVYCVSLQCRRGLQQKRQSAARARSAQIEKLVPLGAGDRRSVLQFLGSPVAQLRVKRVA